MAVARTGRPEDYDAVLRAAADVMVLMVVAEQRGEEPAAIVEEVLRDATARATESGALGTSLDESDGAS